MKTIVCEKLEFAAHAADYICAVLRNKPDAVLALACGETMLPVWEELRRRCGAGELSFHDACILCVTEFCDAAAEKSCRTALQKGLLDGIDADPANCFFPDPAAPESYDALIETLGGIDLALLGIGEDAHIGYNEPGTLYDTGTHVQKLTERTKRQLLKRGFTEQDMPNCAVTMGIRTLTKAREILVLACGEDKAAPVFEMLYAKTMPYIPAAYLQIPLEVTVLLDSAAASRL